MNRILFLSAALGAGIISMVSGCGKPQAVDAAPGATAAALPALPVLGPAPAWQLKDVNGNLVRSEQFKGRIVVVDFWATWCGPCKVEIPGYIELARKYSDDLTIVGVSVDQGGVGMVKAFVEKNGMNYPVVMFDEGILAAFGGVEAIPTTFLIDRTGQIRDRKVGAEHTADYEKKILALLR